MEETQHPPFVCGQSCVSPFDLATSFFAVPVSVAVAVAAPDHKAEKEHSRDERE
jgi:hypothetical protein